MSKACVASPSRHARFVNCARLAERAGNRGFKGTIVVDLIVIQIVASVALLLGHFFVVVYNRVLQPR
jgi:hypothetical protein